METNVTLDGNWLMIGHLMLDGNGLEIECIMFEVPDLLCYDLAGPIFNYHFSIN